MRRCMCVECDVQDRDDALVSSGKPGAWANDHVDGSLEQLSNHNEKDAGNDDDQHTSTSDFKKQENITV